MKTLISYLDDLKEKCGSDYKIAKLLKTNQSTIGMIRSRNQCGDETAIKIADLLGIDRSEVLIAAAIARSDGEVKHAWEHISKMSGMAASVAIASTLTLGLSSAEAGFNLNALINQVCILCKIVSLSTLLFVGIVLALESLLIAWSRKK